jgi:hypothetical protein
MSAFIMHLLFSMIFWIDPTRATFSFECNSDRMPLRVRCQRSESFSFIDLRQGGSRRSTMKTLVTRRQALAATYALTLAPFTAGAAEREKVGMQLILAADVSGSVNATRYKTQHWRQKGHRCFRRRR